MKRFWRLFLIGFLGMILIAGGYYYVKIKLSAPPEGKGPAGPSVAKEVFAGPWAERKILLLGLGDSITAGFGVPMEKTYFRAIVSNPPDDDPAMQGVNLKTVLPNLEANNLAISGSTSLGHVDQVESRLEKQPEDVFGLVTITTGGNDLIHNYGRSKPREGAMYGATYEEAKPWIENYETRLNQILDGIQEKFPGGCLIFLGDIYDPTDGVGDAATAGLPDWPDCLKILKAYNDIIHLAVDRRTTVVLVPIYDLFLGHGLHCRDRSHPHYRPDDPYYWYAWNLEDPNARGYDALRRLFLLSIAANKAKFSER